MTEYLIFKNTRDPGVLEEYWAKRSINKFIQLHCLHHGATKAEVFLMKYQNTKFQTFCNTEFYNSELLHHSNQRRETFLCLKTSLDPVLLNNILEDVNPGLLKKLLDFLSKVAMF